MKVRTVLVTLALAGLSCAAVCGVAGCGGVRMNAEYSQLLDRTAALADASATRAEIGLTKPADMATVLRMESDVWQKFRDARDGKKPAAAPATQPVP
jgi:hypothetical protein